MTNAADELEYVLLVCAVLVPLPFVVGWLGELALHRWLERRRYRRDWVTNFEARFAPTAVVRDRRNVHEVR